MISLTGARPVKVADISGLTQAMVMQSFAPDILTGQWYVAQTTGSTGGVEDLRIYRCSPTGQVLDYATIAKGGHGNSIALEHDGGDIYIWYYFPHLKKPYRWRYSGTPTGKAITETHADVTQYTSLEPANRTAAYYAIDEQTGRIASAHTQADGTIYFTLRNLADYKAGTNTVLQSLTTPVADGVFQGLATAGDQLLVMRGKGWESSEASNPEVSLYDWTTGQRTGVLNVDDAAGVSHGQSSINEAEGICAVPDGTGSSTVLFGIVTGTPGLYGAHVYRLTKEAETVAQVGRGTLLLDLQEVAGQPMGDAAVQVSYDRDVRRPGGGLVPRLPERFIPLAERDRVEVVASDDPNLAPESAGFRIKVVVQRGYPHGTKTYYTQLSVDGPATVALSEAV